MKLHAHSPGTTNRIAAYGPGYFVVNDQRLTSSIIVTPGVLIHDWPPRRLSDLRRDDFLPLDDLATDIVLLGTGRRHRFPDADLLGPLLARGLGVEVMSSDAACRTYNILMAESRRVAAMLIVIE